MVGNNKNQIDDLRVVFPILYNLKGEIKDFYLKF